MRREKYKVAWSCPSNIALIKYWGKKPGQLPMNPSLSFGLQNARTKTSVQIERSSKQEVDFLFEGKKSPFSERVVRYLETLKFDYPWIQDYSFLIKSENSFPHSAGIASSASAFGALALCLADISLKLEGKQFDEQAIFRQASRMARLGSGSACRSMISGFALWGKTDAVKGSTDCNAVQVQQKINPIFNDLRDAVLLVDSGKKKVSSSAGHQLMNNHPYKESRILQAQKNLESLLKFIKEGDVNSFFEVAENEALSLHALMLSSSPSFMLLKPQSLLIIDKIRSWREQSNIPVGFTIDAGPNIHLLYFDEHKHQVHQFINDELLELLENSKWLDDRVGDGPKKLE